MDDLLPIRAFIKGFGLYRPLTLEGKSDSPPAPDYTAAANATAAGNLEAARATAAANRVNQVTPYGTLTYTQQPTGTFNQAAYDAAMKAYVSGLATLSPASGQSNPGMLGRFNGLKGINGSPGTGSGTPGTVAPPNPSDFYTNSNPDGGWTATQTLAPAQQQILDQTNKLNLGLMSTANTGLQYANNVLSKPGVDTSTLPQIGINPGQSYQDAMMARLQPQIDRENQQSDAQLANQGITQGSEAYKNAKTLLGQQHNDLLNSATVQGFNTGLSANQNAFQQTAYNQMQPINLINALRTGSQVQNPTFAQVPQQQTTAGADLLGATNAQYQAQSGNVNAANANSANMTSGLVMAGAFAF